MSVQTINLPGRVAVHEAGHAAVRLARGLTLDVVTVVPDEGGGASATSNTT